MPRQFPFFFSLLLGVVAQQRVKDKEYAGDRPAAQPKWRQREAAGWCQQGYQKSGGSEPCGSCEVHKLPAHDVDGNDNYTLTGAGKRCNCKGNVEDFVVTIHGCNDSEDVKLCPNHFLQLYKRSDVLRVETIAECDSRLRQEEGARARSDIYIYI